MKIIEQISEHRMVSEFVNAELKSPRFGKETILAANSLGIEKSDLIKKNYNSKKTNLAREKVLEIRRGWLSKSNLFKGFPKRTRWFLCELDFEDFARLRYINCNPRREWGRLSRGTHLVSEGADYIFKMPANANPTRFVREIFRDLKLKQQLPPIIIVTDPKRSRTVVIEGSARATAYYRALDQKLISKVVVILGVSKVIHKWCLW